MKDIILDSARWSTKDDVYDAFFRAVGAPEWHGRNFDALRDSIARGLINQVECPYWSRHQELRQDQWRGKRNGRRFH